jgi:hypothetical protein
MLRIVFIVAIFLLLLPFVFKIVKKKVNDFANWKDSKEDAEELYQEITTKKSVLAGSLLEQEKENKKQAVKIKTIKEKLKNEK